MLAGCALVLDSSSDLRDHCSFDGADDNVCGICLELECQAQIDACCGDPSCQDVMDVVDECGSGDNDACLELDDDSDAEPILICLANKCQDICGVFFQDVPEGGGGAGTGGEGEGGNAGSDGSDCFEYGDACQCSYGGPGNDIACDETLFGGAACCADFRYPDEGICTCEEIGCEINFTYDTCTCRSGVLDPSTATDCGAYSYCCQGFNECRCNNEFPCDVNETPVPSCSFETIPCPTGVSVTSCSFP